MEITTKVSRKEGLEIMNRAYDRDKGASWAQAGNKVFVRGSLIFADMIAIEGGNYEVKVSSSVLTEYSLRSEIIEGIK